MNKYAAALYRLAPVWGQNLLLNGFATLLERERYGGRYPEYKALLEQSERWSRSELEAYQDERLRAVVAHAYETVPFYRRRFDAHKLKPADIRTSADLPKVPLLTRQDVREHFDDLVSTTVPKGKVKTGHTSGTTGTPLTVGYDRDTIWMTYAVFDRHYRWAGLRMGADGDPVAVARGNVIVPLDQKHAPFWRLNRRQNQLLLSSFHMSRANLPAYFDRLSEFQPAAIDGYPSTLYLLAKYLHGRGEYFPLRAAVTSSETLFDFQRAMIEERFQCRVFDYYALAERAIFSHECEAHQGHHIAMEYGITEAVDMATGVPVSRGSTGKLIGTTLHNTAMPLIRYVTNDVSGLRADSCPCGRALELMEDVTTKAEDVLTLKDGRMISPSVLTHPFKPLDCIEGSQIIQTAPDAVTIKLIPGSAYTDWHTQHLIHEFHERLGADVTVTVEMVDRLDVSKNGKFKWVISQVPLGI
jgi:phenylacetate-CoA ligase